mmetsp:Transcript_7966/g.17453  ORF Transcript_7966/g.17453 Transcript_7966/m.17453 type:complete len:550 (-) Transcript_7966:4188-5837(-)
MIVFGNVTAQEQVNVAGMIVFGNVTAQEQVNVAGMIVFGNVAPEERVDGRIDDNDPYGRRPKAKIDENVRLGGRLNAKIDENVATGKGFNAKIDGGFPRIDDDDQCGVYWEMVREAEIRQAAENRMAPKRSFDFSEWLANCKEEPASDPDGVVLNSILKQKIFEESKPFESNEFVCKLGCARFEPELEESMKLLQLQKLDFKDIWGICTRHEIDTIVWIHDNIAKYFNCKPRVTGSKLLKGMKKVVSMLLKMVKVPNILYGFDNSDFAVPDNKHDWLQPIPGVVRYVGTPAHSSILFPNGAYLEATTHRHLMFSDTLEEYWRVLRDMDDTKKRQEAVRLPWDRRSDKIFWRGSPTGVFSGPRSLDYLPRFNVVRNYGGNKESFEVGFLQFDETKRWSDEQLHLFRNNIVDRASPRLFCEYKFLLHCDGNTASWGLAQKFTTGSLVLWIESLHKYREFYYTLLKPWVHYVPVALDMLDLDEIHSCLRKKPEIASRIAKRGLDLFSERLRPSSTYCYIFNLFLSLAKAQKVPATPRALQDAGIPADEFQKY